MSNAVTPAGPGHRTAIVAVRDAQIGDLDALQRIETAAFATDRISRRSMRRLIGSGSAQFLAGVRGAVIVGYSLTLTRRGSKVARLYSLAVAGEEAGRGTGRMLLEAAEAAAAVSGSSILRLEVRTDNRVAIRLYETRGYRLLGQREDYYEDGCGALQFERPLTRPT